jgi:hypothetical protein
MTTVRTMCPMERTRDEFFSLPTAVRDHAMPGLAEGREPVRTPIGHGKPGS